MTCDEPLGFQEIVDYFAGELDEGGASRVEEHLFGCARCSHETERVARIVAAVRSASPPFLSESDLAGLKAQGLRIEENAFVADQRKEAIFRDGVDVLVHHLTGLDLQGADRLSVRVLVESTGALLFEDHFIPFDRDRGEVLVACRRHFDIFPPDIIFEVRAHRASGPGAVARFYVPHAFEVPGGAP